MHGPPDGGETVSAPVIETRGLRKVYSGRRGRQVVAVEGLDLVVEAGGVHGFLGPNGSGKTTTIRLLLGLARPSAGSMQLFGEPVPAHLPRLVSRIGAVVESPKFFPGFTGRRNLDLLARAARIPRTRVDTVLERVGLTDRADDRYKGYSLGMRQRLAIAATLLGQPQLLVLDEPTNGLDPQGIRDIRTLVRELSAGGVTVLLSSHLLAEVAQVCDAVSIVRQGRLLASGPVDEVVTGRIGAIVRVEVADPQAALAALERAGFAPRLGAGALLVPDAPEPALITRVLADEGLYVSELVTVRPDLEEAFLEITGRQDDQA